MNTPRASSSAYPVLGLALSALVLAVPSARAQSAVSMRVVTVAGSLSPSDAAVPGAAAEALVCSGGVTITTRAVTDTSLPPGVVVSVDAAGLACTGQSSRGRYVTTGQANLTRLLAASDVIQTTLAVYRDVPGGIHTTRAALLTLDLSYDTATGALTAAAARLGDVGGK